MLVDLRSKIYYVTPEPVRDSAELVTAVRAALRGGVGMVQYRRKQADDATMYHEVEALLRFTRPLKVPLVVNDRVDIALAAGADGVHVGESDLPVNVVRRMVGPHAIVGVSAERPEQARLAERGGASYLGCGAVFPTATKPEQTVVGLQGLATVMRAVTLPVCAIGGITVENLPQLQELNPDLIAVIAAVNQAPDREAAARQLVELSNRLLPHRRPGP